MADSKLYVAIWAILVEATIMEVVTRFMPTQFELLIFGIVAIATMKAVLIALYFQHLKYEPKALSLAPIAALLVLSTLLITAIISMGA